MTIIKPTRFIILPTRGFTASNTTGQETLSALLSMQVPGRFSMARTRGAAVNVRVLSSLHENGPKLVEMTPLQAFQMRQAQPGLRIVPEVRYQLAKRPVVTVAGGKKVFPKATMAKLKLKVIAKKAGMPLPDVHVVAFTNYAKGYGAEGTTNGKGEVSLSLPASTRTLEKVYLYSGHTAWPMILTNVAVSAGPLALPDIDLTFKDSRMIAVPPKKETDGQSVRIGILDTGCGPHKDVVVAKGVSAVYGDTDTGYHDTEGHGTHVAGVIAARGSLFLGIAPSVTLNVYRVFPRSGEGASNFDIGNAIDQAVADKCDLLNMSLGGGDMDQVTDEAIKSARARGTICVIAAGNDSGPVANPGAHPLAVCVSAIGIKGAWPKGAMQDEDVTTPAGKLKSYIASFSNTGPEVDITSTGCGIISTYPNDRYAVMDGTSMACPCATGAIARLLAQRPAILGAARDAARADQIAKLALDATVDLGFSPDKQGAGLRV